MYLVTSSPPRCQVPMPGCSGLCVQYLREVERKQGSAYKVGWSSWGQPMYC